MSDSTHSEKLTLPEQLRAWSGNSFGPYRSPLPEMLAAADEIERLQHDLSRSVEATTQYLNEVERLRAKADLLDWLLNDPDRCTSAVDDAYNQWDGNEPSDWRDILNSEIAFHKLKEKRDRAKAADSQPPSAQEAKP